MPRLRFLMPFALAAGLVTAHTAITSADDGQRIDYSRSIRPIFSDNCYTCHGPDEAQRQTQWRLDLKEPALGELDSGGPAVVPGNSAASGIYLRITSKDESERMPPPDAGKQLADRQISLIKEWIDQGAAWQEHWAFIKPERHAQPDVEDGWPVRNPIDRFVLGRLEREGLAPSPEADPETLIRRVTLDLTGLAPTLAEIDSFVGDRSENAYEKLVDRLLSSPRYGET